jgi:hypothetical protein
MIPESQARKLHSQGVPVVQKGDKGWTSDADGEREYAARTPGVEFYNGDKRPWAKRSQPDYSEYTEVLDRYGFEPGQRGSVGDDVDVLTFEKRADGSWRLCYIQRNAAL